MKTSFAVFAAIIVALVVLGASYGRTTEETWVGFQKKYSELSRAKGATTDLPLEVKQDRLSGFGLERIDRCRSCHIAVDDPRFTAEEQPLRTHPDIAPHSFNEFGCTVCHEGDGRATTADLAHGKDPFWVEPLLTGQFVESACARCHETYYPQMAHLKRGAELFEKTGCMGCHKVQGLSRGNLGLELTEIGLHRDIKFFHEKLKNPLFNQVATLMPKFRLSEQDIADLATYLKSLKGRQIAEDAVSYKVRLKKYASAQPPEVAVAAEAGKQIVDNRGCLSCHKLGSVEGGLAPDLSFLGQVRDAKYVVAHLTDPRAHTPGSNMPNFWLSQTEKEAVATYLTSLTSYTPSASQADRYKELCSRCHGEKGDGMGVAAENLLPRPRVFTNAKFFNWLPEERAYRAIRDGVPGTAMPAFGKILSEQDAHEMFAWVRKTFIAAEREPTTPRVIPAQNPIAYSPESVARGKVVFLDRCYGCHGRAGDGKGPNAPEMLPRPRNLANHAFFEKLPDTRLFESITYGIVGTGMPPWDSLPDDQRWDLVNYVRFLSSTGPGASERGN